MLDERGDQPIPNGGFVASGYDLVLWTRNANNHQQTYGVLGAALNALNNYMFTEQIGTCTFSIYDGENMVGTGGLGIAGQAESGGSWEWGEVDEGRSWWIWASTGVWFVGSALFLKDCKVDGVSAHPFALGGLLE